MTGSDGLGGAHRVRCDGRSRSAARLLTEELQFPSERDTGAAAMLADRIGVMSARPGRMLEIIETRWGEERGSKVVASPRFGEITARLWELLREESQRAMAGAP